MLLPDIVLQDRYLIVRQLGQGGMGAVYEAVDQRLDTTVALKESFFADERLRKQFEREARLLARMHHPALPRVSDHFSEGDGQFLIMQFIAGDDLAAMMVKRRGTFPPDQVLTWADQLLDALDYLHTQDPQIVHRDIKPQNLKLTSRGQIILLDFGLAKGQASEISRITTSASIFGYTPNYAPLEQIQGLGTDPRSDLYALAATLYHLITGVKPPDALTRAAALVNGQVDPLRPASEVNTEVAPGVDVVLQKAMAQNRDQRYSSAAEMRRALQGTEQAATVANRGEAQTVLFPPPPPPPPIASAATQQVARQDTVSTGETTVVRGAKVDGPRRLLPWALSAVAMLVLAAGAWGFYALQHRTSSTLQLPNAAGPNESPAANAPSTGATGDAATKTATEPKGTTTEKTEPKSAKNEPKTKPAPQPKPSGRAGEVRVAERPPTEPDVPETPDTRLPNIPRRGRANTRVEAGGTVIRNFPDGTQMITTPDGTRILVTPDGQKKVLRLGEKMNRRKHRPQP
jgi:serine/threonine protein kinase